MYACIQPAANFNLATVRAHILSAFQPQHFKLFQQHMGKIPQEGLCNIAKHNCPKLHTRLTHFDEI